MGAPKVQWNGKFNFLRAFLYITMNDIFTQLQNEGLTLKIDPLAKKLCSDSLRGEGRNDFYDIEIH